MKIVEEGRNLSKLIFRRLRDEVIQESCCRECGEPASWWDDVCENCGMGNPVRVPRAWLLHSITITVTSVNLLLLLLRK
jgi:hypothetical protein